VDDAERAVGMRPPAHTAQRCDKFGPVKESVKAGRRSSCSGPLGYLRTFLFFTNKKKAGVSR
jgi:hypothetical protein